MTTVVQMMRVSPDYHGSGASQANNVLDAEDDDDEDEDDDDVIYQPEYDDGRDRAASKGSAVC